MKVSVAWLNQVILKVELSVGHHALGASHGVLQLCPSAERNREQENDIAAHLETHDQLCSIGLAFEHDDKSCDGDHEDSTQYVHSKADPSVGDNIAESRIGVVLQAIDEFLPKVIDLVHGSHRD